MILDGYNQFVQHPSNDVGAIVLADLEISHGKRALEAARMAHIVWDSSTGTCGDLGG